MATLGVIERENLVSNAQLRGEELRAGLERLESTSSEGNSQVQLNFEWGQDLSEAVDEVRTRVDRLDGKFDTAPVVVERAPRAASTAAAMSFTPVSMSKAL